MPKAVLLTSLGCRTNQEEMTSLSSRLVRSGHSIVDDIRKADIVIINTCFVTSGTEAKARRMIMAISRLKPGVKICVTGCLAQHSPLALRKKLPVTWVVGNTYKHDIPDIIIDEASGIFHDDIAKKNPGTLSVSDVLRPPQESSRTRFFLKIQEGCDNACAYCVVPLVRGPSRSAPAGDLEKVCKNAIALGYKEIVITGTHIGQYRDADAIAAEDSGGGLFDIVKRLAALPGDFRLRLSSLDPEDMTDDFCAMIGSHPKLCRHCHVSVQSLSARVVASMGRPDCGDFDTFLRRLAEFRRQHQQVGLGGDFIVGFPGETEEMFQETVTAVKVIGFSYGHVFRYSRRPGTRAASMDGQIDEKEKNRRSAILRSALDECHKAFVSSVIGQPLAVLVESEHPAGGLASNYLRCDVPGCTSSKNTWLRVAVSGTDPESGRCIAAPAGA
jgi:threonylcarbamoyladenosine tRNA methylthiotransferase MtaB